MQIRLPDTREHSPESDIEEFPLHGPALGLKVMA